MHGLANPLQYQRAADAVLPWACGMAVTFATTGTYLGLFVVPLDLEQGEVYRIMYVHVPAAWMALMVYGLMAVASVIGIVWRHPLAEIAARAAAPIGATFCVIALVTGSLWGEPTWGTYWVWDPRLTTVLILFFFYIGYMVLYDAFDNPDRGARAASILCLVGLVDFLIIWLSVEPWFQKLTGITSLHQPASVGVRGSAIDPGKLVGLVMMWAAFLCYFTAVHILRTRAELTARKIRNLRLSADPAG
jgi:heme exporter protein C